MSEETSATCFVCGQTDDLPLIQLRYTGRTVWICPADMPKLIHQTHTLAEALKTIETSE